MKIATLNIDWAKQGKVKIEKYLDNFDFDFLILTESIDLDLKNFKYKYFCKQIPENQIYEGLNYSEYLNQTPAFRTAIYSKIPFSKSYDVEDFYNSLALEFEPNYGKIIIYASILGTWFRKKPFAEKELKNLVKDCRNLSSINENLFIIGDLNTSFLENEKDFSINSTTTSTLINLFAELNLFNATKSINQNIDHIIIPNSLENSILESSSFVEKNVLSDHKGIKIILQN